jgi:hypothetical protein
VIAQVLKRGRFKNFPENFGQNRCNVYCEGKGLPKIRGYRVDKFEFIYLIFICSDDKLFPKSLFSSMGVNFWKTLKKGRLEFAEVREDGEPSSSSL